MEDLYRQCKAQKVDFEILCFDDGSIEDFKKLNKEVAGKSEVIYQEMPQNLGRSGIRNKLGEAAQFPFLLFMDCDSKVVGEDYIANYLNHIEQGKLVYGGRVYSTEKPENQSFVFHWEYGSEREVMSAKERKVRPWHSFMTNNFLVPKDIFLSIQFDESLKQYGHEDTLFGLELKARNIPIIHIEAPLEHIGLETVESFLKKTGQGLENLLKLYAEDKIIETKLLKAFKMTRGLIRVLGDLFFRLFRRSMEEHFASGQPNMKVFDVYKLTCLCHIWRKSRRSL